MTFAFVAALTLVATQVIKLIAKKVAPTLGNQRLFTLGVNLLVSLGLVLKAMPQDQLVTGNVILDILLNAVLASGVFSTAKNSIQGMIDIKTLRTGGSVSVLLLCGLVGFSSCISVPFKGDQELTCQINTKEGSECLMCAGDVVFQDSGVRHVEQTMCLTKTTPSAPAPSP